MSNGYRVRWFENGDEERFLETYALVFQVSMSKDYFHWKYVENPLAENRPHIIVVEDRFNELVGFRGCFLTRLRIRGETFKALSIGDLMVHPDHRRRGLNRMMIEFLLSEFDKTQYRLYYNFPRSAARLGNLQGGWRDVSSVVDSIMILNPYKLVDAIEKNKLYGAMLPYLYNVYSLTKKFKRIKEPKLEVSLEPGSHADLQDIYLKWEKDVNQIYTVRDFEYLNWRFEKMPLANPRYYKITVDDATKGYLVVTDKNDTTDSIYLTDYIIFGNDRLVFKEAVRRLLSLYQDKGSIITWAFTSPGFRKALQEIGFLESTKFPLNRLINQRYFVSRPTDLDVSKESAWEISRKNLTELNSWYLVPSRAVPGFLV